MIYQINRLKKCFLTSRKASIKQNYLAYSTNRVSRIIVNLILPG